MRATERNVMELDVPGSPEAVFDYLVDLNRLPEWDKPVRQAVLLDESMQQGARWQIRLHGLRTRRPIVLTVVDLDRPRRCEYVVRGHRVTAHDVLELRPTMSGCTHLTITADVELRGVFAPGARLVRLAGPLMRAATVHYITRAVWRAVKSRPAGSGAPDRSPRRGAA
ncbi:SRPBCC family protein [Mycobacterium sp. Marseille-P9652]|uniref:SRPBCC family protein n=1 Tax=Mycobacterium sp. Marseille-P9652 TaxID=2654950 RepID=UPI0012E972CB|nr:SRPBCC family protein [Mycobacterium sp. Marseille-P9652]